MRIKNPPQKVFCKVQKVKLLLHCLVTHVQPKRPVFLIFKEAMFFTSHHVKNTKPKVGFSFFYF
ncbi:MAG: hypothetical protein CMJ81_22820 [Planctomycetaceae bacterium]|nr:hypothetical protein [Planctomycetaceae bacterium]MBP61738.1 hypothetical protein [Planctomycetaceae bacterium]